MSRARAIAFLAALALWPLALTGCQSAGTVWRDRPVTVEREVLGACVGEQGRPAPVRPLRESVPPAQWQQLDAKQKAALVGQQLLLRQTYGEQLAAATGACR